MSNENQLETEPEFDEAPAEYKEFDPKAVENELLQQANDRAMDPGESAAQMYTMYVPHFKRLMPKMSVRGLRRVINYMVLFPLEQVEIKNANETEKQFMQLVNSLVEAKFVLIMDHFNKNAEAMYAAQNTPLTTEEKTEVIESLRAGGVSEEEIDKLNKGNE